MKEEFFSCSRVDCKPLQALASVKEPAIYEVARSGEMDPSQNT